jgi:iron complex outermembrane receptor protein
VQKSRHTPADLLLVRAGRENLNATWSLDMTETPISRSIRRLFAGGGAAGLALLALPAVLPLPALAQEAAPKPVQRVEITGSNIRRSEAETASSVITMNRADIERSGKNTVAELLQTLAVDNQGSVPTSFGNGFAAGASGISLRGLGAASTLVLLNGRRMAPYGLADDGQKQFSDLNVIPTDAVDRIEVLKDGASAIYGSDAIAGVVNIILRRDYDGNTARVLARRHRRMGRQADQPRLHQGRRQSRHRPLQRPVQHRIQEVRRDLAARPLRSATTSAASTCGRGAIRQRGAGRHRRHLPDSGAAGNAINGNVRNPLDTANYYNRGNLAAPGFTRLFPGAACSNFTNHPQGDPGGGCLIDGTQVYNQIEPKQENLSFFARGTWQYTPEIQLYSELNYYTSETDSWTTPSSVSASVGYPGGPVNNAVVRSAPTTRTTPTSAPRRACATWRPTSARGCPTSAPTSSAGSAAPRAAITAGTGTAPCCSRTTTSTTPRTATCSATSPSPCSNPTAANVAAAQANSPAYAALPPGTVWRIGENAFLNSPAMYAALSPTINNTANSKIGQWDFKGTREFAGIPYWPATSAWRSAANGATRKPSCSRPPAPNAATSSAWAIRPMPGRATCSPCTARRWRRCPTTSKPRRRCAGTTSPTSATRTRRRPA